MLSILAALLLVAPETPPPATPPAAFLFVTPMGEAVRGDRGGEALVDRWFAAADTDHDGKLGRGEFRADALRVFASLDRDGDGRISPEEVTDYEARIVPEITGGASGPAAAWGGALEHGAIAGSSDGNPARGPAYSSFRQGAARFSILNIPEPVAGADADFDRTITRAEFVAAAARRFALLDSDEDGALARAELPRLEARKR